MNTKILRVITDAIATRNIEVLDVIYPGWGEKDDNYTGEWKDFVFEIILEKLLDN